MARSSKRAPRRKQRGKPKRAKRKINRKAPRKRAAVKPRKKRARKAVAPKRVKRGKKRTRRKAATPKRRRAVVREAFPEEFAEVTTGDPEVFDYGTPIFEYEGGEDEGDAAELPTYGERDAEMLQGARELYEGVYSREEIADYIDDLADYFDMDAHDLYDMFYGYGSTEV